MLAIATTSSNLIPISLQIYNGNVVAHLIQGTIDMILPLCARKTQRKNVSCPIQYLFASILYI